MQTPISPPLSWRQTARLAAGDVVLLSGPVPLLRCNGAALGNLGDDWPPEATDGGVCCFVAPRSGRSGDGWEVARLDELEVDRAARSLLAVGGRGVIAAGQCLATTSYALRKYGGLFFAVDPTWLTESGASLPPLPTRADQLPRLVAVLRVDHAALTVSHDTHGRSLTAPGSLGGR